VLGVRGTRLSAEDRERLSHPLAGMVILFAHNFESSEQLIELCASIHALRDPALLIAVDHEGGRVQRFRSGFTRLPPMRQLGELWDRDVLSACRIAAQTGYVLAAELRAHGVDFSFAPVLDLDHGRSAVIGDRALHSDARVVSMLASYLMHGMQLAGVANCGKHFPGHGWAEADSHVALPVDTRPRAALMADAAPYRWLGPLLAGVMPAHVLYPAVDARPAGFSRRWIEGILRAELGFTGAVFSDDLLMAGAAGEGTVVNRAEAALAAGCDVALVCNDTPAMDQVLDKLRWQTPAQFTARVNRLMVRGPSMAMRDLRTHDLYRQAVAALAELDG
jgi:beta-N-acetylhexosaminidase